MLLCLVMPSSEGYYQRSGWLQECSGVLETSPTWEQYQIAMGAGEETHHGRRGCKRQCGIGLWLQSAPEKQPFMWTRTTSKGSRSSGLF